MDPPWNESVSRADNSDTEANIQLDQIFPAEPVTQQHSTAFYMRSVRSVTVFALKGGHVWEVSRQDAERAFYL